MRIGGTSAMGVILFDISPNIPEEYAQVGITVIPKLAETRLNALLTVLT